MSICEKAASAIFEANAKPATHWIEMHPDTLREVDRERGQFEWKIGNRSATEISRAFLGFRLALNDRLSPGEIAVRNYGETEA